MIDFKNIKQSQNIIDIFNETYKGANIPCNKITNARGVYLFTDAKGGNENPKEILYIGKAEKARSRLKNYNVCLDNSRHYASFVKLLSILSYLHNVKFDRKDIFKAGIQFGCMVYFIADNDNERLESELIQHFKPKFNKRGNGSNFFEINPFKEFSEADKKEHNEKYLYNIYS